MAKAMIFRYESIYTNEIDYVSREVMELSAAAFRRINVKPDFIIIDSLTISKICLSAKNYFEEKMKETLKKEGFANVEIICHGIIAGKVESLVLESVLEKIKKEGDGKVKLIGYFTSIKKAAVIYQIIKK